MTTIKEALTKYTDAFKSVSDTAHLDAEVLTAHVCQLSRAQLFAYPKKPLSPQQEKSLHDLVMRHLEGEPIAYLVGHKEFWDLELSVTSDVLIPRPETECIVEWILKNYESEALKVADLGVGSGAIALALAKERPQWQIHATDISTTAIDIAKQNSQKHQLSNIHFFHGEWCAALPDNNYDIIVSNPPYIDSHDKHLKHLTFEPKSALDGGEEGLDDIKIIIHQAIDYLNSSGLLIFEHGYDQRKPILLFLKEAGYTNVEDHDDLSGQPRFSTALKG